MTTKYKLTYFSGRGRAEITRLIFAAADVPYEDIRIEPSDWLAMKGSTPFGQLPILEFDDIVLCQGLAIARYIARKYGLAGKSDLEQARADMIIDCCKDTSKPLVAFLYHENDAAKQEEAKAKFFATTLPHALTALEKFLVQNNGGDGFFVGDGLTWADLAVYNLMTVMAECDADKKIAEYPKLAAFRRRVEQLPRIAAWLAKRPVSRF